MVHLGAFRLSQSRDKGHAFRRSGSKGSIRILDHGDRCEQFCGNGNRIRGVSSARYNLPIMLLGFTCIVGFIAVIGIARALRARSVLNENRRMRDYIRRITSDLTRDF